MIREGAAPAALLVALPHDPVGGDSTTHWWRVIGDRVDAGAGSEWLAFAADVEARPRLIGLAPAALVRLTFSTRPDGAANLRQAATIARMGALDQSLGEAGTLHSATVNLEGDPPTMVTAVVANSKMQEWLDWAEGLGVRIDHIVPVAMVLPLGDQWTAATIGRERILGRRGMVLPDEPGLKDALLGQSEVPPDELESNALELALVRIAEAPEPDLRTGRFARRRRIVIERMKVRELALLTLAIILMSILLAVVEIVKLDTSRSALDAETLAIARQAAGSSVTLDNAEAALAARAAPVGGGSWSSGVAAVLARLQPEPSVSLSMLDYSGGTLSFTVSGQEPNAINRVLLALQRDGYRVSAVPRPHGDGRVLTDVTLREGP